jgi:hypothetical protein
VGAVGVLYERARRLGSEAALGTDVAGQFALGQVLARVSAQGARLAAVRLAQTHAAGESWHIPRGFEAHDLDDNRTGVADHPAARERR